MSARARRPSFSPNDKTTLISLMRDTRLLAVRCYGAERPGTATQLRANALKMAIDDLAGELTGDPELFWAKPHGGAWVKPSEPPGDG